MGTYKEVYGDLIKLALKGEFDVITHGCNCFCAMGAGIAPLMARTFGADRFEMEHVAYRGDINKLGTIDYRVMPVTIEKDLTIVNSYTQYGTAKHAGEVVLDYSALELCLRKMNHVFKGKHIGLPLIGGGLAGGDPEVIKQLIKTIFTDCDVTLVLFGEPVNN
jgi:O-acetyl-ADP-ribose deacetylase (regulator of RNase III)